ncbi:MAG: apolipoprotein N-acyltransferase [Brevinemataceae bacterium]
MKNRITAIFEQPNTKIILSFLLWSVLTTLSFAMFNLPLIWISFVPLIYIIHQISIKNIVVYGFWFSVLYYLSTIFWVIAFHESSILVVFPVYSLYAVGAMIFTRYASLQFPRLRVVMFPLFWIAFEIIRSIGFFGFRWNTPVDALWKQIVFMQTADIIGGWGVSFLILLVNACLAEVLLLWKEEKDLRKALIAGAVPIYLTSFLFLANLAYGIRASQEWKKIIDTKLYREKVALLQPNRPGHVAWIQNEEKLTKKYMSMIDSVTNQKPDLILQTEIMISTYLWNNLAVYGAEHPNNYYLNQFVKKSKEIDTPIMLTHFAVDKKGRSYNASTLVSYSNDVLQTNSYNKIHLVPFGEWMPGASQIKWLDDLFTKIGAAWASPGENLTIFKSKNGILFSMLICFEDLFAILGRLFVDRGAQYFVNSTNDGWAFRWKIGSKVPLWQHLANTAHTSVSLRRSIARSVNTGISGVVDPMGRMDIAPIEAYQDGVYVAEVPVMPRGYRSPYVKGGWIVEFIIFFMAMMMGLLVCILDKKSKLLKSILK